MVHSAARRVPGTPRCVMFPRPSAASCIPPGRPTMPRNGPFAPTDAGACQTARGVSRAARSDGLTGMGALGSPPALIGAPPAARAGGLTGIEATRRRRAANDRCGGKRNQPGRRPRSSSRRKCGISAQSTHGGPHERRVVPHPATPASSAAPPSKWRRTRHAPAGPKDESRRNPPNANRGAPSPPGSSIRRVALTSRDATPSRR